MSRPLLSDPLGDIARRAAASWRASYQLRAAGNWWSFDPITDRPSRQQGWKLHVSATPATAPETLRAVADVVLPRGLSWKAARTIRELERLNAPPAPVSQVGKFATVYLDDDADLDPVAEELHQRTRLLGGPVVPSDLRYRRGSNVYLRYGAFAALSDYPEPDQVRSMSMVDPSGRLVPDGRAPGRATPAWIAAPRLPPTPIARRVGTGLFGRDLTVLEALHQSAKGGVYRCDRLGTQVVLKEARIGTVADALGRDARSRLLNEWRVLRSLAGTGLAPEPLDFFFAEDNAYLVVEHVPGETLRSLIESANYSRAVDPDWLVALWRQVSELVNRVREHGVGIADLTPGNIMVGPDRCVLIDHELSVPPDSAEPPFVGWTPGYAGPGRTGAGVDAADVEHALAAVAHFILTGVDPAAGLLAGHAAPVDGVLTAFWPDGLPRTAEFERIRGRLGSGATGVRTTTTGEQVVADAVAAGRELVRRVEWDRRPWPWPDAWSTGSLHPASFAAGTIGIAQFYLDVGTATGDQEWFRHAGELLEWTVDTVPFVPGRTPPGLHFGLGAAPWLMARLGAAERAVALLTTIAAAPTESWDLTHGRAGVGLAALGVWHATGDPRARAAAADLVTAVLAGASERAGLPTWPRQDRHFSGFAHGSAGVGYFLLAAGAMLGDERAVDRAVTIGHALIDVALPVAAGRGLTWRQQPESTEAPWTHWCNGAAGVGLFLNALWRATGTVEFGAAAVRSGLAITGTRPFGSCGRCHGLAGDGDYLVELADSTGRGEFRSGAQRIGRKLDALLIRPDSVPAWPHEGDGAPRPGFMRGFTGIHSFRLRLYGYLDAGPLMLPPSAIEVRR